MLAVREETVGWAGCASDGPAAAAVECADARRWAVRLLGLFAGDACSWLMDLGDKDDF